MVYAYYVSSPMLDWTRDMPELSFHKKRWSDLHKTQDSLLNDLQKKDGCEGLDKTTEDRFTLKLRQATYTTERELSGGNELRYADTACTPVMFLQAPYTLAIHSQYNPITAYVHILQHTRN